MCRLYMIDCSCDLGDRHRIKGSVVIKQQTFTLSTTHHAPSFSSCTHRSWEPLEDGAANTYCFEEAPVLMPDVQA